ncbi:MAG: tRNA pseudouridine(38-40) synthase TruA [Acidimicrobiia bacterium]|nr:tRNA pseudouridine(38-40) synthase TruA [Acidimicrobiia bacterium]
MPTYRIDLAYDGSGFRGWAANAGVRTVQGRVEEALAVVLRHPVETVVAGRTDAGVHAHGQVASFVTAEPLDPERLQRSLNRLLAPEVVARAVAEAPEGFDARRTARARTYRYCLDDGPVPDPTRRWTVWHCGFPVDEGAMNRAAAAFVGEHDFASLCRAVEGAATVRRVLAASWRREPGGLVVLEVRATAFCHQMVRSMVALCVEAGRGRLDPAAVPGILESRDRGAARGVAPPHGLTLWEVEYP